MKSLLKRAAGILAITVGAFVMIAGFGQDDPTFASKYGLIALGGGIIGVGIKLTKTPDPISD